MRYALSLGENGRVLSVTFEKYAPVDAVVVDELPEGNVHNFRFVDGEFIEDPYVRPRAEVAKERIAELKQKLSETDYNILKIVEGASSLHEMTEVITQRALWRKEINDLEREVENE
jgi:hypothetical protein